MIVKLSEGFVNLANMTDARFSFEGGAVRTATVYWAYAICQDDSGEHIPARDVFGGDDAHAIYDALDVAAQTGRHRHM